MNSNLSFKYFLTNNNYSYTVKFPIFFLPQDCAELSTNKQQITDPLKVIDFLVKALSLLNPYLVSVMYVTWQLVKY